MTQATLPDGLQPLVLFTLQHYGYDGLFNADIDCACVLDDLMPCDAPCMACQPGYRQTLKGEDLDGGYDFRLGKEKETPTDAGLDAAWPDALERTLPPMEMSA